MLKKKIVIITLITVTTLSLAVSAAKSYDVETIKEQYATIPEEYNDLKEQYEALYKDYIELAELYNGENTEQETEDEKEYTFVLNTKTKKIHHPDCTSVNDIAEDNYLETNKTVEELEAMGYTKCGKKGDWK